MKQKVIYTTAGALNGLTQAIGGATQHGAAIGLKQNDAASLTTKHTGLVNAESALDAAKAELKTRKTALAALLMTAIAFLTLARDLFKPRLGTQYSTAWDAVGFIRSLVVSRNLEGVKFKLQKLIAFLTANPSFESAELNITVTRGQMILDDIVVKENAVNTQKTVVSNAVKSKNGALKTAIKALGSLVGEMKGLVNPLDQVYLSFGLKMPGAFEIPSVPTNLIAVLIGATAAALQWKPAERAERYRIWKKTVGVDEDFVLVESRNDLDFVIEGLPVNSTTQVAVSAVNNGGESAKSEVVTIVTQ